MDHRYHPLMTSPLPPCRDEVITLLARLYESTGRAIAVNPASASALALALASALLKMLKFLVKVFLSLYLLKLWMDQVDTLHVGRYWSHGSEVL